MANKSASSALAAASLKSQDPIKSETAVIKSEAVDIRPEYTDDKIETSLRTAFRTNVALFTRRTTTSKIVDHSYLSVARFAAEALQIDKQFFYVKPWWPKLMEIVNDEITTLSAALTDTEELRIEDALRATVASFVCTTTVDGTTSSVIDYAGIYRAVENKLGLGEKALSHNGRFKELRRAVVKDEVAKIEAAAKAK